MSEENSAARPTSTEVLNLATRGVVTAAVLAACLYMILSQKFPGDAMKWAYGTVGVILGYWFR